MAVSVAAMRALKEGFGIGADRAAYIAGHSLGEYSALASSGAISVADCARVLRIRGDAMQSAVPAGEGAMAALLGATPEQAVALCEIGATEGPCEIANDNAPGQIVISGAMAEALSAITISAPTAPLVANVTATAGSDGDAIRRQLIEQVTGQVRWTESVQYMAAQGVELTVEAGAGKVLTVMNRRTVRELEGLTMGAPEEIEAVAARLNG